MSLQPSRLHPPLSFTILITTYNRYHFLQRAIQSSLAQTYPCEILVCDDASRDDTAAYCQQCQPRIRYLRNETNQGHAATVNMGLSHATGEWIKLLDDDDMLEPHCLATMASAIVQHPQAVVVSSLAYIVTQDGKRVSTMPPTGPGQAYWMSQQDLVNAMLLDQAPLGQTSRVAFRRDIGIQVGGWNQAYPTMFDEIAFWMRLACCGDAIFINLPLVSYTQWMGSHSRKIPILQQFRIHCEIKKWLYEHGGCYPQQILDEHNRCDPQQIPPWPIIEKYLRLHWMFAAVKHREWHAVFTLAPLAWFHLAAWKLLIQIHWHRRHISHKFGKHVLKDF